ncbi:MAG: hypothetical protein AAF902_11540, partial [Chloroflexota bacterium]
KWTQRKRIPKVENFYQVRLTHLNQKISQLRRKFPWLFMLAIGLNRLSNRLSVKPVYSSGIAKRYRSWPDPI